LKLILPCYATTWDWNPLRNVASVERFYSVEFLSHYSSKLAGTKDVDEQGHSRRY